MVHRKHIHAKVFLSLVVLLDAMWVKVYEIFGSCSNDIMGFARPASQNACESVHFHDGQNGLQHISLRTIVADSNQNDDKSWMNSDIFSVYDIFFIFFDVAGSYVPSFVLVRYAQILQRRSRLKLVVKYNASQF
jgi:hypothetical protein